MDNKLSQSHHSRIYDNFLMHWKYIKREKVGGKWRYTYKDDKYDEAKKTAEKAQADYNTQKKRVESTMKNVTETWKKVEAARATGADYWDEDRNKAEKAYDKAASENTEAHYDMIEKEREYENAVVDYKDALKKYRKSVGHDVADALNTASDKIDSAKKAINNAKDTALDKISAAADKGKEWIESLISKDAPNPTLSDPNGKTFVENVLVEDVIIEDNIIEDNIIEDVIVEDIIIGDLFKEDTIAKKKKK